MTEPASPLDALEPDSLERIAGEWLVAEQELAAGSGNPERSEAIARERSGRYDERIRTATREELRLAWEAARKFQSDQEMGSEAWANARRLAELLRNEYLAADPDRPDDAPAD